MASIIHPPAPITVMHEELAGSPEAGLADGVYSATRKLKCAWAQRNTLMEQLAGKIQYVGPDIIRTLPHELPEAPYAETRVRGVSITPWGAPINPPPEPPNAAPVAVYSHCELSVSYSSPRNAGSGSGAPADPDGLEVEETVEPTVEFLSDSSELLFWGDGRRFADVEAPGKQFRSIKWVYTKKGAASVPPSTLLLAGKCNEAEVYAYTLGMTFAAETLLYEPPTVSRNTAGIDVSYRFVYKSGGWNKFWNQQTQAFESAYLAGGAVYKPYPPGNFFLIVR